MMSGEGGRHRRGANNVRSHYHSPLRKSRLKRRPPPTRELRVKMASGLMAPVLASIGNDCPR